MYLCICMAVFLQTIKAEIFTSMADMEKMVLSEKKMIEELRNYLHSEETKLKDIKKFLARVDDNLQLVNESDVGKYLGNPVNSYLMLKRFNVDWKQLEKTLEVDLAESKFCSSFLTKKQLCICYGQDRKLFDVGKKVGFLQLC